ncbi:hypothetical protein ABPG72_005103 [Tetrahymena utriculariae]
MAFFCIQYYMYKSFYILNLTAELSTSFFTQIFASLCADFFSILPVAYFTKGLSIISLVLFGYQSIFDDRLFFLALFFSFICLKLYYVSFTYIIYDSAYSLKKIFNNAWILSLLVLKKSMIAKNIVKLFGLSYYNTQQQEEKEGLYQLYLNQLLVFSSIGLLLVVVSAITLQKRYGSIQRLRETSQKYKLFTIYQGIGINLKLIYKYFRNKDFIYLCILCCIGCSSISLNNIFFNLQSCGKFEEFEISLFFFDQLRRLDYSLLYIPTFKQIKKFGGVRIYKYPKDDDSHSCQQINRNNNPSVLQLNYENYSNNIIWNYILCKRGYFLFGFCCQPSAKHMSSTVPKFSKVFRNRSHNYVL